MLKSKRSKLILLVVGIQILFFCSWYFVENLKLTNPTSKTILVKTVPVDPRDLISGNYFILNYQFSSSWGYKKKAGLSRHQGDVYAVLQEDESGKYYEPEYLTKIRPRKIKKNQVVLKGNTKKYSNIEFGIEKYFINEGTKEPNPRKDLIEVLLIIDENHVPKIKKLFVNNEEFQG